MGDLGAARLAVRLRHLGHRRLLPAGVIRLLTIIGCRSTIKNEHSFLEGGHHGILHRTPPRAPRGHVVGTAIGIGAALSLVVGIIVLAFAWPSVTAEPGTCPSRSPVSTRASISSNPVSPTRRAAPSRSSASTTATRRWPRSSAATPTAPSSSATRPPTRPRCSSPPPRAPWSRRPPGDGRRAAAGYRRAAASRLDAAAVGTAGRDGLRGRGAPRAGTGQARPRHPPHRACPSSPRSR